MPEKASSKARVIGFIDMDSFEVQIYLKHVYKKWKRFYKTRPIILADTTGERIISVNPIAKNLGISREDIVTHAQVICKDLLLMRKKSCFNKPESKLLRHASWEILDTIVKYRKTKIRSTTPLEHCPSDEFYLDLTEEVGNRIKSRVKIMAHPNFYLETYKQYVGPQIKHLWNQDIEIHPSVYNDLRFIIGAMIMHEISVTVFGRTNFESSVGVSENKLLAKLACSLNKPQGITVLTRQGFNRVSQNTTINKLKGLGGDLGDQVAEGLNFSDPMTIQNLKQYKKKEMTEFLGIDEEEARFAFDSVRGVCNDEVIEKLMTNSINVSKTNYRNPKLFVQNHEDVRVALDDLCDEMTERLEEDIKRHARYAKCIQIHIWFDDYDKKGWFEVDLKYFKNTDCLRNEDLSRDVFRGFKKEFKGNRGRICKISISAKPKL